MRGHPRPPSQTWRTFLTNHASQIMAADLFVVPTVTFRLLFVPVILAHDRRRIIHVEVTAHPTAGWLAQQLRNAFPEDQAPRYLVHDRDGAFADVATTVAGMHVEAVRTGTALAMAERARRANDRIDPPRVPRSRGRRQRGRLAPSARVLRHVLHALADASSRWRKTARCLAASKPASTGPIVATPEVGGLHHRYDRVAA
jgi:hypothetical protein